VTVGATKDIIWVSSSVETPKREMDVVRSRLRMAQESRQTEADRKEGENT